VTRRRWIADEHSFDRAKLGQEFDIAAGPELRRGRITRITDTRVDFELGEALPGATEVDVSVYLAVFKFDRFEWAVEKLTELGAARIIPLIAARTDVHLAHAAAKRAERWRRIAREAAEQSRRLAAPEIADPQKLTDAMGITGCKLLLAESGAETTLAKALEGEAASQAFSIAVGPEGGWSPEEPGQFVGAGWRPVSLGPTILRAETAALAAMAVIQSRFA
jgi:16S rRNA (uracil1498-N3)-methyltransferase